MSAVTRATMIVMPARLPGWFVKMEVRDWMNVSVKRIPMSACSVVLVCVLSGSGSLGAVLTSSGGLLLSRESRDFKFNLHLNSSIFNITVNFTSTDLDDENEELMQGGANMLTLLDAGDFCLSQVN